MRNSLFNEMIPPHRLLYIMTTYNLWPSDPVFLPSTTSRFHGLRRFAFLNCDGIRSSQIHSLKYLSSSYERSLQGIHIHKGTFLCTRSLYVCLLRIGKIPRKCFWEGFRKSQTLRVTFNKANCEKSLHIQL
uniref:Ovule protein n=1 Tax=Mesocestoides corti TaxID=53468 RepID=A0A5K3EWA0_MESCO